MFRYCKICKKEFDFKITSVKDLDTLICPECGNLISRDSKKPADENGGKQTEHIVGKVYTGIIQIGFISLFLSFVLGYIAYFFKWDAVLYIDTVVGLIGYAVIYGLLNPNILYVIIGALGGTVITHSLQGCCIGLITGMFVRRVLGKILMKVIASLVTWSKKI